MAVITSASQFIHKPAMTDQATVGTATRVPSAALNPIASSVALSSITNSQVLSKAWVPLPTLDQLDQVLDTSGFTDADWAEVSGLADKFSAEEQVESKLTFDPGAWEKHVGVLIAAIIAVNISRQTSAQLKGSYAVMAAEAAEAQGMSIIEAGKAVMNSAITGAAVAGAMAMGGMSMSLKGQSQKHADIKTNKQDAQEYRNRANDLDIDLKKNSFVDNPADNVKGFKAVNRDGTLKDIELQASGNTLTEQERAVLKQEIAALNKKASASELASMKNEVVFSKNLTIGQALSGLAMVLSSMVGAVVGWRQYSERQNEVLAQSDQTIGKSLLDEATQRTSEETSQQQKLMEIMNQVNQGRAQAASNIAGGLKA